MNNHPWLDIFLLCHNRPESTRVVIQSILNQNVDGFNLIVSDNSSDDRVARMVQADFPDINLRHRGCVPALQHFNICISEVSADYFCLFHDDDVMGTDYVAKMHQAIERFPEAVAIGANAWEVNIQKGTRKPSVRAIGQYQHIASANDLFRRYYGRYQGGNVPFPSYIYRTVPAGKQRIPEVGGKHADVIWLLQLATLGSIVWLNKPSMDYIQHGGNDSSQESRRDRLSFFGYIKKSSRYIGHSELNDYRYIIYKKIVDTDSKKINMQKRVRLLRKLIKLQRLRRLFRVKDFVTMLTRKFMVSLGSVMS